MTRGRGGNGAEVSEIRIKVLEVKCIVFLKWQILVYGDFVCLEPVILKTSEYVYKMMKFMYNISELSKVRKCLKRMVMNCPVFEL